MKPLSNIKLRAKPQIITLKLLYTEESTCRARAFRMRFAESAGCVTRKLFIKTERSKDTITT